MFAHAREHHLISTVHPQSRLVCERHTLEKRLRTRSENIPSKQKTKFEPQLQLDQVFAADGSSIWRLMKGDTNCAECGSAYLLHEKYAEKAKKQWKDN